MEIIWIATSHVFFEEEKTKVVHFFYKLPTKIKDQYLDVIKEILPERDYLFLIHQARVCTDLLKNITPEKYRWIVEHTDDATYYTFCHYYEILQPTLETIINANNLYDEYPEYLI